MFSAGPLHAVNAGSAPKDAIIAGALAIETIATVAAGLDAVCSVGSRGFDGGGPTGATAKDPIGRRCIRVLAPDGQQRSDERTQSSHTEEATPAA